jgi:hypothetical protein
MATDEAGGGVPGRELRERMIEHMRFSALINEPDELTAEAVDEMLAFITAAGFELVESERMDRLRNAAGRDDAMNMAWRSLLKPGDLAEPGGRE